MRLFTCDACSNTVHFDNTSCVSCNHRLGYVAEAGRMTALEPVGDAWHSAGFGRDFAFCANEAHGACNWLVPYACAGDLCIACRHNRTIPDLSIDAHATAFRRIAAAERHAFYSLLRWHLPAPTKKEDAFAGLAFDFLAESADATPVMSGHEDGVITLAIAEADDAEREARRTGLGEPYRTLLGHFRHELGHYYWDRLVRDGGEIDAFRALFGDERVDYAEALRRNYADGPPADWSTDFVSAYAASHPWEDFAETFAHHWHIVDALETARAFGMVLGPRDRVDRDLDLDVDFSPYETRDFAPLAEAWPPLTVAMNTMNRSLGQPDLYPFVLSQTILGKLEFIHGLVMNAAGRSFGSPHR